MLERGPLASTNLEQSVAQVPIAPAVAITLQEATSDEVINFPEPAAPDLSAAGRFASPMHSGNVMALFGRPRSKERQLFNWWRDLTGPIGAAEGSDSQKCIGVCYICNAARSPGTIIATSVAVATGVSALYLVSK
jgi:hypothetical protein